MAELGTEHELQQVLRDLWAVLTPEERERVWPFKDRLKRVLGEKIIRALSPERLQQPLQLVKDSKARRRLF
jgi:hypothetical protein